MDNTIVIKIGGNPLQKDRKRRKLLKNLVTLSKKYSIIIVHGGKKQIEELLKKFYIKPKYIRGNRYTDKRILKVVHIALSHVNKQIVDELGLFGATPFGLSGLYGNLLVARRIKSLGYVGKIKFVNAALLESLMSDNGIPVIFSISKGERTNLNVNADVVASEIAIAMKADKLIYISDVPGVINKSGKIIKKIKITDIGKLKKKKVITGGMIPKIEGCQKAIQKGVRTIHITDTVEISRRTDFSHLPGTQIIK